MRTINLIAMILVVVGALNWLLVGLFSFDLVASIFANGLGTLSVASRVIYTLVGLSGLWLLFTVVPQVSTTSELTPATESAM